MASIIPITLIGENLGKRHLYLNSLVNETYKRGEDFDIIKDLPEESPIDRLFKIDLASKIRNVEYIIQNLKDDDMLYVSRALKSTWLIEKTYEHIINPQYLTDKLYPEMITTAVTKMQHWVHLNLKDEIRCRQFYQHYKEKKFDIAIKFLLKCSKDDVENEFLKVIHKITPHYFKILCEKSCHIAQIFYDTLSNDNKLKCQYLDKEKFYFSTLKYLLKKNGDMVLDITEKYFNRNVFDRFSPTQTKLVMSLHKNRFMQKPELYTGWLLNTQAIADSLDRKEAKDLVLKLARAKYLTNINWFCYKSVEPFIKRLKPDERVEFKKKVFVNKDIGKEVEEWPYAIPEPPICELEDTTMFDDHQPEPYEYEHLGPEANIKKKKIMKKKYSKYEVVECYSSDKVKTLLDKLFDEYRFVSFGQTLYDLRKRIAAESLPQNREFMMLVLVSKSGGRPEAIALLLELLARHCNEPHNVRAAIIRSLVKRAHIWRLPENSWNQLLEFGHGLGLDGNTPVVDCYEGLHAVVIRSLLLTGECGSTVQKAFLGQFSTLTDYSLTATEQKNIGKSLSQMLLIMAKEENNIIEAVACIDKLINTLNAYKIKIETYLGLIDTIAALAEKDISEISYLLTRLFNAKVARKELFRYTFDLVKSDDSYLNALRHDPTVLDENKFAEYYVDNYITNANQFLTKLSIYFSEDNGLTSKFLSALKAKEYTKILGRPLAFLLNGQLKSFLQELDVLGDVQSKLLSAAIRANAHIARPVFDIDAYGLKNAGAKHAANRLLNCRTVEINNTIEKLLKWKQTAKLALTLSKRTTFETEVFTKLAILRPAVAIKSGLKLMKLQGDALDPLIWETIKPIIQELDMSKTDRRHLVREIEDIYKIPLKIRPEYSTVIYTSFKKISYYKALPPLCHVEILLPDINEQFIENILLQFLNEDFTVEKLSIEDKYIKCTCLYIRILVKYLLLCKTDETQKRRFEKIGDPFLTKMEEIRKSPKKKVLFTEYLQEVLVTLKYSKVFFNNQYVSSLPVMEKVVIWMQKLFSIDEHFKTFTQIHLCMLYFKALRQGLKLAPEVFSDDKRKHKEGIKVVGNLFGKYIAREVNSLTSKYYDSITELYNPCILTYLSKYNYYEISSDFLYSMIKGILEESRGSEYRLGVNLLQEKFYYLKEEHSQELIKYLKGINYEEAQWFAYGYF